MIMGIKKNKEANSENHFVSTRNNNTIRSKIFYLVGWYCWFVCTVAKSEVAVSSQEWCEPHIKQKNTLTQMPKHIVLNYLYNKKNNVVGWKGPKMFVTNAKDVFSNASGLDFYKLNSGPSIAGAIKKGEKENGKDLLRTMTESSWPMIAGAIKKKKKRMARTRLG